ncbi:Hypothetical protein, putative [Bodo saltans]|uniref:Uncharacterized protein n=1 Tax=Bodo saltans TaxID=75058 RepID=A0A0S4J629_BODSA|nr:Hypothetical protein, putative [Bodo saltans]|eukprot:CUG83764.1 Hypothetical protein, putative [Bodo saltans]
MLNNPLNPTIKRINASEHAEPKQEELDVPSTLLGQITDQALNSTVESPDTM